MGLVALKTEMLLRPVEGGAVVIRGVGGGGGGGGDGMRRENGVYPV